LERRALIGLFFTNFDPAKEKTAGKRNYENNVAFSS